MDCRREELLPSMAYQPALAYQSFQRVVQESKRIFIPSPTQPQLLDWLPQVPSPWPTSHTLYQLSSTIKWYGWEHGKDIQESDCKGNPVRPTMVFFPPGVQSYTVNKQFQQKYYLADNSDPTFPPSPHSSLTPELHTSVRNCQDGKQTPHKTNSSCRSLYQDSPYGNKIHSPRNGHQVQYMRKSKSNIPTQLHPRYYIQKEQEPSEIRTSFRYSSQYNRALQTLLFNVFSLRDVAKPAYNSVFKWVPVHVLTPRSVLIVYKAVLLQYTQKSSGDHESKITTTWNSCWAASHHQRIWL